MTTRHLPEVFIIQPHRGGWQFVEAPGVQPFFTEGDARTKALTYALSRTAHRVGEIRIVDAAGEVLEVIPFDERARKL